MEYMFPDYNDGLVNVMASIEHYFGIKNHHNGVKEIDEALKKGKYKNVVLFLFDGFGNKLLEENKLICPFLYKHLVKSVSSNFPSTTMSARTTAESALEPVTHGWLGWDMYFKKYDEVITLTKNVIKGTSTKPDKFHVAKTLLSYEPVVEKINKLSGCYAEKITVYSNHPGESLKKARRRIKRISKSRKKTYVYAYYNEPDHALHKNGTDSMIVKDYLKHINDEFEKLCSSLKNTLIIAIADHGHINVEYINISDYPRLSKMIIGKLAIDDRATSFRVKKGYLKEFPLQLKKVLKDDFIIMSKNDVIEKKLYGSDKENAYFRDGLGDYFAIGISNKAIRYDSSSNNHVSAHSGLTLDEMLVPVIMVSKP